jgi:hypothetical protein
LLLNRSKTDLPATVERLLADQGKRYGQIRIGHGATFVKTDDPALLDELMHERKLAHLTWRLLAPGLAAIENAAPNTVLEAVRKVGHLPVLESMTKAAGPAGVGLAAPASTVDPGMLHDLRRAIRNEEVLHLKWNEGGRSRSGSMVPSEIVGSQLRAYNPSSGQEVRIDLSWITDLTWASFGAFGSW